MFVQNQQVLRAAPANNIGCGDDLPCSGHPEVGAHCGPAPIRFGDMLAG